MRRHHKRLAMSVVSMVVIAFSVSACGNSSGTADGSQESEGALKTLTFVNPLPSYAGWKTAEDCMKEEAESLGINFTAVGPSGANVNNAQAVEQINRAIASGQEAIAIAPLDESFQAAIDRARDKGILVGAVDTLGAAKNLNADIGVGLETIGKTVVDGVGAQYPDAQFATLSIGPSSIQEKEFEGMQAQIDAKYPDMKIITKVYDNGDLTKDVDLIKNMLLANPQVDFIFSANGASTSAVVTAIEEAGRTGEVKVIVNDLTPESISALKDGTVWGVNDQGWCTMGTNTAKTLADIAAGDLPKDETYSEDVGVRFVTAENLEEALADPF